MTQVRVDLVRPQRELFKLVDVVLAVAVALAEIIGTTLVVQASGSAGRLDALGYALLITHAAPLAVRGRYPIGALLAVAATSIAYTWLGYPSGFYTVAMVFAVWASVAAGYRFTSIAIAGAVWAAAVAAGAWGGSDHMADPDAWIWLAGWLGVSVVLGEVSRGRREYLEQVEQRALDAEHTREEEALRRAGEERLRIARELHDVLAHNISLINVQAGVALHLVDKQPEQARTALAAINQVSKEALRELRATLGVLRQVDEVEPRGPTPGLDQLGDLVANASRAGVDVAVEVSGPRRPLPAEVDLTAYRIVQESLTNVARHSGADEATVSIQFGQRDLIVEIEDEGSGASPESRVRGGNGLVGMRERVTCIGGTLEAAPRSEGGFRVRAWMPADAAT